MDNRYRILLALSSADPAISSALSADFDVADYHEFVADREALLFYEPDLAIIDIGSNLHGITLCKQIREVQGFHQMPVVMLYESDDPELLRKAYGAGASLMLRRPMDPERLIRNVQISLKAIGAPRPKKHPAHLLKRGQSAQSTPAVSDLPPTPQAAPPDSLDTSERDVFIERKAKTRDEAQPPAPSQQRPAVPTIASVPRVMMVDDDPDAIEMVQLALMDEYEVIAARDGLQALERILEYEPDLIILDVMMPKMNGYQLCHSLRRNSEYMNSPILFLSAKTGRKDRDYAFQCGATAYMTKPFNIRDLCEMIRGIVQEPGFHIRPKRYNFNDIHLRERAMMKEKEDLRQERERRQRYEEMKKFIRKNI